jgi:hypothetical protein
LPHLEYTRNRVNRQVPLSSKYKRSLKEGFDSNARGA